jgi:hypothetical protein
MSLVIPSGSKNPIKSSWLLGTPQSCIWVFASSILPSLGILLGTGCLRVGIDPGADLLADDLFLVGGLMGGLFFGLAGARGTLKMISFLGVTAKLSLFAGVDAFRVAGLSTGRGLMVLELRRLGFGVCSSGFGSPFIRLEIDGPGVGTSLLSARSKRRIKLTKSGNEECPTSTKFLLFLPGVFFSNFTVASLGGHISSGSSTSSSVSISRAEKPFLYPFGPAVFGKWAKGVRCSWSRRGYGVF